MVTPIRPERNPEKTGRRRPTLGNMKFLLLVTLAWFVAEWPQFLGPERNGNAEALAVRGMPRPQRVWRAEIGTGYSSPVLAGGVVYAHSRRGADEVVTALDWRSGKTIWQAKYKAPFRQNAAALRMQDGPFATPLVHAPAPEFSCWS